MPRKLRFCNPGTFDRKVVLEFKTVTQDETGQPTETWVAARTMWAHRRDMTGYERFRSQQELATRVSIFTVRWFSELTAGDWRIVHDKTTNEDGALVDLVWDITGISEPENTRRQYWELTCAAVGA